MSRRWPSWKRTRLVAQTELRVALRSWRQKGRLQQLVLVGAGILILGLTAFAGLAGSNIGEGIADGEFETPVIAARIFPAGLFVGVLAFSAYMTIFQYATSDTLDGLLTTVPHREVTGGLLFATFLRVWAFLMAPLVVAAIGLGVGAGSPLTVGTALVALAAVVVPGYILGFTVGVWAKHLFGQSAIVVRYRAVLGILALVAYIGILTTDSLDAIAGPVIDAARKTPIAWSADLALIALVDAASLLRASMAGIASVALICLGVWACNRVTAAFWYADPVTTTGRTKSVRTRRWLRRLVGRPAAWVATKSWLRARRAPLKLIYVIYPVFLGIQPIESSLSSGSISVALPAFVAVYGAWTTGAAFGLNPLGDEGAVLPITAISGISGQTVVRGLLTAGLVPGLPLTVGLTGALAIASPLPGGPALAMTVGAGLLCVAAAGLAVGIGAAFPRYDAASLTQSREAVVPSTWAFVLYSIAVLLLATPATAVYVPPIAEWIGGLTGLGTTGIHLLGMVVALTLVGSVAVAGVRYCAGTFENYTVS